MIKEVKQMTTSTSQFKTMDEYIATFPKEVRSILKKLRQTIRETAPEAVETISYQMPTFKQNGEFLVSFAAWEKHIGLYPIPAGTKTFQKEMSPYRSARSTVRFPMEKPLPLPLIRKIVKYRLKENSERKQKKGYGK